MVERNFKVRKQIDGLPGGTIDLSLDWGVPIHRRRSATPPALRLCSPSSPAGRTLSLHPPRLHYSEAETLERLWPGCRISSAIF